MTTYASQGVIGIPYVVVVDQVMRAAQPSTSPAVFNEQRLPTDPIGTYTLNLTNVVVGSRIHVEKQSDGASFYDDVAATSTAVIPLSVYSSGSPYNELRIKVRKASSGTTYQPWETLSTAVVGSNSIYVSQIPDE